MGGGGEELVWKRGGEGVGTGVVWEATAIPLSTCPQLLGRIRVGAAVRGYETTALLLTLYSLLSTLYSLHSTCHLLLATCYLLLAT